MDVSKVLENYVAGLNSGKADQVASLFAEGFFYLSFVWRGGGTFPHSAEARPDSNSQICSAPMLEDMRASAEKDKYLYRQQKIW